MPDKHEVFTKLEPHWWHGWCAKHKSGEPLMRDFRGPEPKQEVIHPQMMKLRQQVTELRLRLEARDALAGSLMAELSDIQYLEQENKKLQEENEWLKGRIRLFVADGE